MKMFLGNTKLIAGIILAALFISACTSREEKVAETIKNEMFKNLYDFESYQPIETKIDTLRRDKYGDTLIYDNIMLIKAASDEFDKAKGNFDEQKEICEIYKNQYSKEARSITREDIDYLLKMDVNYDNYTFKRTVNGEETTYILEPQVSLPL